MRNKKEVFHIDMGRRNFLGTSMTLATAFASANLLTFPSYSLAAGNVSKPSKGGRFILGIMGAGKAESLDPAYAVNRQDLPRLWNLYDSLFRRGADGVAYPQVLSEAAHSADYKTWTLTLRQGVKWHNGEEATSEDLLYTINSWSDPKHAGHAAVSAIIDFGQVRKLGPLSVEVPLYFGVRDFPSTLTMVNFVFVKKNNNNTTNPIGTGPFKYVSFTPGSKSVFNRNDDYWNEAPYLDELIVDTSFADQNARLNALQAGKIHAIDQVPYALAKINQTSKRISIINAAGPSFQAFIMRLDAEPFNDVRVRQALRLIPNRSSLVNSALNGYGSPGNDLQGKGLPFFADDLVREQDLDKAKWLLKSANFTDLNLTLDTIGNSPEAIIYQQQAKAAGVNVRVNNQEPSTFYANYLNQAFATTSWDSPLTSLTQWYLTTLFSKARFPETHYGDTQTDKLLFDAISESDDGKAADKWHAIQLTQFESGGYISWANANYVDAIWHNVRGIEGNRAGSLGGYEFAKAWIA